MINIQSFTFNAFQENTYIIYNDQKQAFIIDPGMYDEKEFAEVDAYIVHHQLQPITLVNTHTHLDHVFGNAYIKRTYNIPLTFHEADRPVYDVANNVGNMYGVPFEKVPEPDFYIKENEMIQLGSEVFDIRLTPGHSPGSVCFYHKNQGVVISGDVLFRQSIGRTDLPGGNYDTLIKSIQTQLFTLPDETMVYSGHGPATSIGLEKMNNPFLKGI